MVTATQVRELSPTPTTSIFDRLTPKDYRLTPYQTDYGYAKFDEKVIPHHYYKPVDFTTVDNSPFSLEKGDLIQIVEEINSATCNKFGEEFMKELTAEIEKAIYKQLVPIQYVDISLVIHKEDKKYESILSQLSKEDLTKDDEQVIKILREGGFTKTVCEDIIKNKHSFKGVCIDTLNISLDDPAIDKLINIIEYMFDNFDTLDKNPDDAYEHAMGII